MPVYTLDPSFRSSTTPLPQLTSPLFLSSSVNLPLLSQARGITPWKPPSSLWRSEYPCGQDPCWFGTRGSSTVHHPHPILPPQNPCDSKPMEAFSDLTHLTVTFTLRSTIFIVYLPAMPLPYPPTHFSHNITHVPLLLGSNLFPTYVVCLAQALLRINPRRVAWVSF